MVTLDIRFNQPYKCYKNMGSSYNWMRQKQTKTTQSKQYILFKTSCLFSVGVTAHEWRGTEAGLWIKK